MNNRIGRILANRNGKKLLVPFLTVGYPNFDMSEALCETVIASGADMLELGIPFSDPLADGPQVQLSSQIALEQGTDLDAVFGLATNIRKKSDIPLIAMGYFNPIYSRGVTEFVQEAVASGIDGLIIPDLPPEEAEFLMELANEHQLSTIFLVAPTSSKERVRLIERASSDFVYAVTVTGVTGAGASFDTQTDQYLARLRKQLKKPFVAGFGVSSGESAVRLCQQADGVVIGSALIREIEQYERSERAIQEVKKLLKSIRESLDRWGK